MIDRVQEIFNNKKIVILGFGLEGQSTYNFLSKIISQDQIIIADKNAGISKNFTLNFSGSPKFITGESYLENIKDFDLIIKSPGIPQSLITKYFPLDRVTSQTNLFLQYYGNQIIGITGTKGKSTTSSLIHHIFNRARKHSVLVGNIGKPPFDYISEITNETKIVFELSSHQLDDVHFSPHVSILLNLFEEHLDHYGSFENYKKAKFNICKYQQPGDYFVFNKDEQIETVDIKANQLIFSLEPHKYAGALLQKDNTITLSKELKGVFNFSKRSGLPGEHNLKNIMAAILAVKIHQINNEDIQQAVESFTGLEHRLEFVGEYGGIKFYNDSIATIPEATIQAVKTLKMVDTLILGGKDRGIDYQKLIEFLPLSSVRNLIFMGDAGKRVHEQLLFNKEFEGKTFVIKAFDEIAEIVKNNTNPGDICLLSPAASSYDMFANFEERGKAFKKIAGNISLPAT